MQHFFSLSILLRTLLSPWRRLAEKRRKNGFDPGGFASDVVVSLMMRIVGFCVRFPTLLLGMAMLLLMVILFPLVLVVWLMVPFLALAFVVAGIALAVMGI